MSKAYRCSGIIVPQPSTHKSFVGKPQGRKDDLEITFQECERIRQQLPGCDICFNHTFDDKLGEYGPVTGKVVKSYWNARNQLCVDFDIDTSNLSGQLMEMVMKKGFFQYLSLNTAASMTNGEHCTPIEVSIVREPARPGSVIFPEQRNQTSQQGLPPSEIRGEHSQLMDAALRNNSANPYTVAVEASLTQTRMDSSEVAARHDIRNPSSGKFVTDDEFAELQQLRKQQAESGSSSSSSAAPMDIVNEGGAPPAQQQAANPEPVAPDQSVQPTSTPDLGGAAPMDVDEDDEASAIDAIARDPDIPSAKKSALIQSMIARNQRDKQRQMDQKRKLTELTQERDGYRQANEAHTQERANALGLFQSVLTSFIDPEDTDRIGMVGSAFQRGDLASISSLAGRELQSVAAALHGKGSMPRHLARFVQDGAGNAASSPSSSYTNATTFNKRPRAMDTRTATKAVAAAKAAADNQTPEVRALMCAFHDSNAGVSGNGLRHVQAGRSVRGENPLHKRSWNPALDHDPTFVAMIQNAAWPMGMDCSSVIRLSNLVSGTIASQPNNPHFTTTRELLDFQVVEAGKQVRPVARAGTDLASLVSALQNVGLGMSANGASLMGAARDLMV